MTKNLQTGRVLHREKWTPIKTVVEIYARLGLIGGWTA